MENSKGERSKGLHLPVHPMQTKANSHIIRNSGPEIHKKANFKTVRQSKNRTYFCGVRSQFSYQCMNMIYFWRDVIHAIKPLMNKECFI